MEIYELQKIPRGAKDEGTKATGVGRARKKKRTYTKPTNSMRISSVVENLGKGGKSRAKFLWFTKKGKYIIGRDDKLEKKKNRGGSAAREKGGKIGACTGRKKQTAGAA